MVSPGCPVESPGIPEESFDIANELAFSDSNVSFSLRQPMTTQSSNIKQSMGMHLIENSLY